MISLAMDTSTSFLCLALRDRSGHIHQMTEKNDRQASDSLLVKMEYLLGKHDLTIKDVEAIYSSIGPGSFTRIRSCLSIAKTLAYALDIPLIPFNTLEVLARSAKKASPPLMLVSIPNRASSFFVLIYAKGISVSLCRDCPLGDLKKWMISCLEENRLEVKEILIVGERASQLSEAFKETDWNITSREDLAVPRLEAILDDHFPPTSLYRGRDIYRVRPLYL